MVTQMLSDQTSSFAPNHWALPKPRGKDLKIPGQGCFLFTVKQGAHRVSNPWFIETKSDP